MSNYENKPLTGVQFENKSKKQENSPDITSKIYDENGKEWNISGWYNTSKGGNKYTSLKISEPYKKNGEPQKQTTHEPKQENQPVAPSPEDDDLPF